MLLVALLVQQRRSRAEAALVHMEARNSAMLRAVPDFMFVMRRDGTYLDYHARDERLLFAPPSVFLGKTIRDIMPPPLTDLFMDAVARAGREPIVVEYELSVDELRYFEARIVEAGPDRVLTMVRDVTEWKRATALNHDLAGRLIASQEAERRRIARELHDDLSQEIALLNIEIDQIAASMPLGEARGRLERASNRIGEIARDVHHLSHDLHPAKLQTLGLVTAMKSLCEETRQTTGVAVHFTHDVSHQRIDEDVSLGLYRIVQEALTNIAKHSRSRDARVSLTRVGRELRLEIADSGVGFDARAPRADGLGLVSMRERASFLKGTLVIQSAPGRGTRIGVEIPVAERPDAAEIA